MTWAAPVQLDNTGPVDAAVWVLEDLSALHDRHGRINAAKNKKYVQYATLPGPDRAGCTACDTDRKQDRPDRDPEQIYRSEE